IIEGEKTLFVDWKGFQLIESVKNGCEQILFFLKEHNCTKVLNDNTNVTGVWSGASEWVAMDWFPRMRAAGLKKFAWVYSPSYFSRMSTDKTLDATPEDILNEKIIRVFTDKREAEEWLKED
ncbi:MAG TPA: hypothetical protein VEC36_13405, partial [Patescibacteria group bacterium]|nr:hypothetical protein [Patescibacteria group bacterium]